MKNLILSLIFFLSAFMGSNLSCPANSAAQEPRPKPSPGLTLAEAIAQALSQNRDLPVAREEAAITRGRLEQARRYPFNPEMIMEGEAGYGKGRDPETTGERRGLAGARIGLSQILEIRGQRALRTQVAQRDVARAEWEVRDTERETIADTMKAFSDLLIAQERLLLTREVAHLVTQLKETADELARSGAVPELDGLRADVERRRVLNRLTLEETAASTARRTLALIIGAEPTVPLKVTGPLLFEPVPAKSEDLIKFARSNRPDLKAVEAALEGAVTSRNLVSAERLFPTLTLSAFYSQTEEFDAYNRYGILGISAPLPIFNRRQGDVSAAEAAVRKHEAQRARLFARIEKEVATAAEQFAAARRVVEEFVARIMPAQEENVRIINEGYRLGEFRLTDALLAGRDLFETRSTYLEAISTYNSALAEIYRSTGMRP
jgi:cobalt-zinc-cadmium efflux system outer membrane protein